MTWADFKDGEDAAILEDMTLTHSTSHSSPQVRKKRLESLTSPVSGKKKLKGSERRDVSISQDHGCKSTTTVAVTHEGKRENAEGEGRTYTHIHTYGVGTYRTYITGNT